MKIGEGAFLDEAEGDGVVVFRFAGEAGEDIGADRGLRKNLAEQFDAARVVFGTVPATHGCEDAIGGGLQRHMEVRREAIIGCEQIDQVLGDVERFDGADAQAFDGSFVENLTKEVVELNTRREIAAIGAKIDAAEDDLAEAGFREAADFGENGGDGQAAGPSAHEWDHAERAAGVATVLNLQRRASVIPFPAEDWSDKNIGGGEDVGGEDWRGMVGARILTLRVNRDGRDGVKQIRDLRLVGVADHEGNAGEGRDFFRGALRVAAGDNDARGGVRGVDFSDRVAGLGIGSGGDRTGVDHNHVRGMRFRSGNATLLAQLVFDGGAVSLCGTAAELLDVEGGHAVRNRDSI